MKTPEDEAFDELARKQGAWGGGFQAKRQMAMDKINSEFHEEYKKMHEDRVKYGTAWSQDGKRIDPMSVYKEQPAAMDDRQRLESIVSVINKYLPPDGIPINEAMSEIISLVDPLPPAQRTWVDLTDKEIDKTYWRREPFRRPTQFEFARDIEQLIKEKNT